MADPVPPGVLVTATLTPDEVRQWERAWDAMMTGEQASWKHRVLMLPGAAEVQLLPTPEHRCRYCTHVVRGDECDHCGAPR